MEAFFADVELWLNGLGPLAYVAAPAIMAAVAILPIPAEAPAMLNGALFGPLLGTFFTWFGAMIGAWISFEISRSFGRPVAERFIPAQKLDKADALVMKAGCWGLLVARFIPFVAFTALNWGAGLTPITRWRFLWTTGVGIAPGALAFTASGTGLAALLRRSPQTVAWIAVAVGLAAGAWVLHTRKMAADMNRATDTGDVA